jgi:hypothetical protein
MRQMNFPLTLKAKMMIAFPSIRTLQRPPSYQKKFLEHILTVQLSTGHLKCAMILGFVFVHVQSIPVHGGITNKIIIHHDHGCMVGLMTLQELL